MARTAGNNNGKHKELDIPALRLADDIFMQACFQERPECAELALRIILGKPELSVREVSIQRALKNLGGRSLVLDILATDSEGRLYNIEIQLDPRGADPRRARYHLSLMDADVSQPGDSFERLPEIYVILITAGDVLGGGKPLYIFERRTEDGRLLGDGTHIVYVNGADQNALTALGRLMHDFFCADPDAMYYESLAEVTRYFKQDVEGLRKMGSMYEEILERGEQRGEQRGLLKGRKEGRKEGITLGRQEGITLGRTEAQRGSASRMLAMGRLSLEEIAAYAGLDLDEVRALAEAQRGA